MMNVDLLIIAVVKQAVQDYKCALRRNDTQEIVNIERFFLRDLELWVDIDGRLIVDEIRNKCHLKDIPCKLKDKCVSRGVKVIAIKDDKVLRFDSMSEASRVLDVKCSAIFKVLNNQMTHSKGWMFRYG